MLRTINDIDKCKYIVNYMVRDSCSTVSKWHQSAALVWYDYPIRAEMMALTLLLRLDFRPDSNHHARKAWMHNQRYDDGVIRFIKTPQEAWKNTHVQSHSKIVGLILIDFWLKLRRGIPGPPVWTSFYAGKKFVWLQWCYSDLNPVDTTPTTAKRTLNHFE